MKKFIVIIQIFLFFHLSVTIGGNDDKIVKSATRHYIKGYVTYDNFRKTPMKGVVLYLVTNKKSIIDSTVTDSKGYYEINQFNGTYTFKAKVSQKWGGGNPTDALLISRYYINQYAFDDELKKKAADVNADTKLNPVDGLLINKRFVRVIDNFNCEDWLIDNNKVVVYNDDIIFNINVIFVGDVDGSHIP